jgi:photosystem II stability/assembly factor-like uncharacterized protein
LADKSSQCGNLALVSAKPDEDMVIASVANDGLWVLANGSETWELIGQGAGGETVINIGSSITYDPDHPKTFWESGIYNPLGVYRTDDDGQTFKSLGTVHHNDFLSLDFTDPDRKTMLTSGHEAAHQLNLSTDAGMTWLAIGDNIPAEAHVCPAPFIIDANTFLLGCGSYDNGPIGIYRSTDTGATWTSVSPLGSGTPPLVAADGSMYWPVESGLGIVKSTDQGQTWSAPLGAGIVTSARPIELPDGRLVTLGNSEIELSADDGVTWHAISTRIPFDAHGFTYSVQRKAFYAWYFTCDDTVPADAVARYDFDYQTQ